MADREELQPLASLDEPPMPNPESGSTLAMLQICFCTFYWQEKKNHIDLNLFW